MLRLGRILTNEQLECDHDDDKCDGCSIRLDLIKALNEAAGKVHTCGKENGVLSDEELMYLGNKLHVMTKKNDVEKLENVIASGAPINALDADMCTPAWVAAKLNNALLLEVLLAHADAKLNQPDKLKRTPLYIAACENNLDALLVLIKVGADVDAPDLDKKSPAFIAAQKNHTDVLKLIMGVGADINAPNKKKESPVFIAAQENNGAALKVLLCEGDECTACCVGNYKLMHGMAVCNLCSMIKRGAADINAPNEHSESPVYTAAKKESMDTLRILIAAGADLNAPNEKGITPLIAAAEEGKASALEALIEARCDIEGRDKNGRSPLFAAAQYDRLSAVQALVCAGADANAQDKDGKTAVWIAAAHKSVGVLKHLINVGADINATGPGLSTPAYVAVLSNSIEALTMLLEAHADAHSPNMYGETALMIAEKSDDLIFRRAAAALLLQHAAQQGCGAYTSLPEDTGLPVPPPAEGFQWHLAAKGEWIKIRASTAPAAEGESGIVTLRSAAAGTDSQDSMQALLMLSPLGQVLVSANNSKEPEDGDEVLKIPRHRVVRVSVSYQPTLRCMFALTFTVGKMSQEELLKLFYSKGLPSSATVKSSGLTNTLYVFAKNEEKRNRWLDAFAAHNVAGEGAASIGITFHQEDGVVKIVEVREDGQAANPNAGRKARPGQAVLRVGHELMRIDGEPVFGKALAEVVSMLMGDIGTQCVLDVRDYTGYTQQVMVTRGETEAAEGFKTTPSNEGFKRIPSSDSRSGFKRIPSR